MKLFNIPQIATTDAAKGITEKENIISDFSYSFVLDADAKIGDKKIGSKATISNLYFAEGKALPEVGNLITSGSDTDNENSAPILHFNITPDFTGSSAIPV